MSKITYVLGAGASYGQRGDQEISFLVGADKRKKISPIIQGIPVVNEFSKYIEYICSVVNKGDFEKKYKHKASQTERNQIISELKWLLEICKNYPTVDTYARLLYVTGRVDDYERLKKAISLFLTLCQRPSLRDTRYDGFIASIIQDDNTFPTDISILSWNYDSQMEFAYADYMENANKDINSIWSALNVLNKASKKQQLSNGFGIVKLNGTAHFSDPEKDSIWDVYYNTDGMSITSLMHNYCLFNHVNVINTLSFAWEDAPNQEVFKTNIQNRVSDTEVLVIIGYSFPYVNRTMDRLILSNMPNLKRVYIQDPNAEAIKERLTAAIKRYILSQIEITLHKDTSQFIVPNELK